MVPTLPPDQPALVQTAGALLSGETMVCLAGNSSISIHPATMAPRRAPHLAEREELDAALSRPGPEALMLFIERHPDSRYRDEAEEALRKFQPENQKR